MSAVDAVLRSAGLQSPASVSKFAIKRSRRIKESAIKWILFLAASISVLTTAGIVYVLLSESIKFFMKVPLWNFLTDTQWTPLFDDAHFGIGVLLSGTLTSSAVAIAIAIPFGTVIAIYLSEFAGHKTREILKPLLELLSGVPTIVFGFFALLVVTPLLQMLFLAAQ